MFRKAMIVLALGIVSSLVAYGVYIGLFGIFFMINGQYFPETREYHRMFAPRIMAMTWVASFSTISLGYLLFKNCKEIR